MYAIIQGRFCCLMLRLKALNKICVLVDLRFESTLKLHRYKRLPSVCMILFTFESTLKLHRYKRSKEYV